MVEDCTILKGIEFHCQITDDKKECKYTSTLVDTCLNLWNHSRICNCPSKNLHCLHQNWIQFYCHSWHVLNIYPSPVYQVLTVNWSAIVKGILLTIQGHSWKNGTHGGHQLAVGTWVCSHWLWGPLLSLTTMWASWLLMGKMVVFAPSHPTHSHPVPLHPAPPCSPSYPPTPSIINTDGRKGRQKIPSNSAIRDREG